MRPKKERIVKLPPKITIFKPAGVPSTVLERITLNVDEFEAIRLADYEQLDHEAASKQMGISRPTFTRLIEKARKKVSEAIINCKELIIEGGNIHFKNNLFVCMDCGFHNEVSIFSEPPKKCENCGSPRLKNMAVHFGHGRCCRNRFGRK